MPTAATSTFSTKKLEPAFKLDLALELPVKLPNSVNYPRGTLLGELTGTNAKQKLTPSSGANLINGGTYTITFGGQTTAAISAFAPASDIQTALEALSTIGNGNVRVTGGPLAGSVVYIEFVGALGAAAQATVTTSAASLTSGGAAAITPASVTSGAAGTPGTFKAYAEGNTDGSGKVDAILVYDCQTDSSGNITFSATSGQAGGEFGQTYTNAPAYFGGYFNSADLPQAGATGGIDGNAVIPGARLRVIQGTIASGIVRLH